MVIAYISEVFKNMREIFPRLRQTNTDSENNEKTFNIFREIFKTCMIFFKILALSFFANLIKLNVHVSRVWTKNTNGLKFMINFRQILTAFQKLAEKRLRKCIISEDLDKFFKTCVQFSRFWRENTNALGNFKKFGKKTNR